MTVVEALRRGAALLAGADKLLVLQDGSVTRFGTRAEVMQALAAPPVRVLRAVS